MELCDLSAIQLAELLKGKKVSSREITESVLDRVRAREGAIHAYITVTPEAARRQADLADEKVRKGGPLSPLTGIPVAVKDNLCTKDIPTTCASKMLADYTPPYDATVVNRLRSEGMVMIGKTNMDEFAMGSSTENSALGPTMNPADPRLVAGGSSGGSAAAVAAGETVVAIGSDTGGSIRQPASFCGVVGMKPTYGRVSRYGLVSYASSLDQVGPLTRTVEDCALMLNALCGHDPLDTTSARVPRPDFTQSLRRDIKGMRIGIPREYFVEGLDERVKTLVLGAVNRLSGEGALVEEVSLPHTPYAISAYYLVATAEASSNLARYDGVKYGFRSPGPLSDCMEMYRKTRSQGFGREVKRRIMLGTYVLSAGYYDAYYLKAQKARTLIKQDFDHAFGTVDCLITPVSPILPFKPGERLGDPLQMYLVDIYTVSMNLAGLPALSIDCGRVEGLPVGLQIIGKPFDEETVIRLAHAYEQIRGGN
jgi:aspartyl-tRNA(Asn)/glutamyl-tRNA(Gln) amidotransferase subunit A